MINQPEMKVRNHPAVKDVSDERGDDHGIWVYLAPGHCNGEDCAQGHTARLCVHSVHEETWRECWLKLKCITKCDCESCKASTAPVDV